MNTLADQDLLRLQDYDGRRYWLVNGWSMLFRICEIPRNAGYPHGVRYSLTLHDVDGTRILGFDNSRGNARVIPHDHWHPLGRTDQHLPYEFIGTDTLLLDFFNAVETACAAQGVPFEFEPHETEIDREQDNDPQADH